MFSLSAADQDLTIRQHKQINCIYNVSGHKLTFREWFAFSNCALSSLLFLTILEGLEEAEV